MIPDTTLHALALRPTVCHPSSDVPLNSVIGVPQAGALARLSEGAFVPVHVNFWPFPIIIEPLMRSPSSRPSNEISAGSLSHWGGMAKRNAPSVNSILAIGRALPPDPTNCPTSVAVPDRSTSSHEGEVCVPRCTTRSHRPSSPSDAERDCARVDEYPPAASINNAPNATREIMTPPPQPSGAAYPILR